MQGLSMLLAIAFTVLITRGLAVADYGLFRYAMTFLALAMTLLQFGWPYSAARLLALENDRGVQREIVGACLLLVLISSGVGTILALVGVATAGALGYHLPRILIWVAPFLYVTLGQGMIGSICQGLNRISLLSFQQVLPYVLLLPITAAQMFVWRHYSLQAAVIAYVAVFSVVIAVGFLRLGVEFTRWRSRVQAVVGENRYTGFPMYIGGLFGVASAQIIAMWVAGFVDPSRYGQYALALAVSSPLSVLVSSVGSVIFRSSSRSSSLSSKTLVFSLGFVGVLAVAYFLATETLLIRLVGSRYDPSVHMAQLLGIGGLMIGCGDIFNRFLGAKGQGRGLCAVAVSTGTVGIVSAAILLPKWNAHGAIASSVLSAGTYLGLMVVLYRRQTARRENSRLAT
jgi:O-antigen/teichoic acid export membrane protein